MRKQTKKLGMNTETVRSMSTLQVEDLMKVVGGAKVCTKCASGCMSGE